MDYPWMTKNENDISPTVNVGIFLSYPTLSHFCVSAYRYLIGIPTDDKIIMALQHTTAQYSTALCLFGIIGKPLYIYFMGITKKPSRRKSKGAQQRAGGSIAMVANE